MNVYVIDGDIRYDYICHDWFVDDGIIKILGRNINGQNLIAVHKTWDYAGKERDGCSVAHVCPSYR